MSGIVEKVKDKVEQVMHKDKHQDTTTTGVQGTHTHGTHGTHGTTHTGPHSSGIANAADPRVDSDRDGSHNMGSAQYGPGSHNTGTHHAGAGSGITGTTGGATGYSNSSTNAGPHDSNLANKLDPRVDSDRDGSRNMGASEYGSGSHHTGARNTGAGSGLTGATGYGSGSTNHGPHDSNLANKMDPRVDSDRDGSQNMGAAAYGPGAHQNTSGFGNTAVGSGSTNYGPHDSNLSNKMDPRVDSDRDGSGNMGAAAYGPGAHQHGGAGQTTGLTGTGPAPNTAGPHSSNLANKLDPRVDSDRDGSRTVGSGGAAGGNTTY